MAIHTTAMIITRLTPMITPIHMLPVHRTIQMHAQSRRLVAGPSWQATVFIALEMVS
jgi:hypothetical protein